MIKENIEKLIEEIEVAIIALNVERRFLNELQERDEFAPLTTQQKTTKMVLFNDMETVIDDAIVARKVVVDATKKITEEPEE